MRAAAAVMIVVAIAGCGRVGFDERGNGNCTAVQIGVGGRHTCVRLSDGTLECVGSNNAGQLGSGVVTTMENTPVIASVAPLASFVAAGKEFTCVLDMAGQPACWGDNADHELDGTTGGNPALMPHMASVPPLASVTAGEGHICGRTSSGDVYCWGDSDEGENGTGIDPDYQVPLRVALSASAAALGAGFKHVCAATSGVECWGDDSAAQLGVTAVDNCPNATDPMMPMCNKMPSQVPGTSVSNLAIACGLAHSCVLDSTGVVACWGSNDQSQCGQPAQATIGVVQVPLAAGAVELSSAQRVTCARFATGSVWCWGAGDVHQLGQSHTDSDQPVQVPLPLPAIQIASHGYARHTCALLSDHSVWCWGSNAYGNMGTGTVDTANDPVRMQLICP